MKKAVFLILYFVAINILNLFSQTAGLSVITAKALMETDKYLASPELAGRMSGSEGYDKAARFMADEFKKLNLKPLGDKGYFEYFNINYNEIKSCNLSLVKDKKTVKEYKLGGDYVCRSFSGSGHLNAPIVFCGYGFSNPELNYDDYAGMDVKGKIVLVFKQNPGWKIDKKEWKDIYPTDKAHIAADHGAAGILLVSLPNDKNPQKPIGSTSEGDKPKLENFPMMHIDLSIAGDLLEGTGVDIKEAQTKIDSLKKPFSFYLKTGVKIDVDAKFYKERRTENVLGMLEGTDPKLKNEYILLMAHLDHVGSQAGKIYFPGANDNASGSTSVLQLARAFSKETMKPKRSIIFMLEACEEFGIDGLTYLADEYPKITDNMVAYINSDCIAFGDSLQVGSGKSFPKLWKIAKEQDAANDNIVIKDTWGGGSVGEGNSFSKKLIPNIYFVTKNSYGHLHLQSDTPETLNLPLFEKVVKLTYLTTFQIALGNYEKEKIVITDKK